jgi:hypothetical protein
MLRVLLGTPHPAFLLMGTLLTLIVVQVIGSL